MEKSWLEYNNEIPLNTLRHWREHIIVNYMFQHIGWTGSPKEPYRHWASYPDKDKFFTGMFDCLNDSFIQDGFNLSLDRIIVNAYNHGDSSWLHADSEKESAWTAILFINEYWDKNWGGDFILVDVNDNIMYATIPKPGKFVLFKSSLLHGARPVSREAEFPRLGIAFQCLNSLKT